MANEKHSDLDLFQGPQVSGAYDGAAHGSGQMSAMQTVRYQEDNKIGKSWLLERSESVV